MATYTVVAGDTMWSIADTYLGDGKKWKELAIHNGIYNSNTGLAIIYVGQVIDLDIPGGSSDGSQNQSNKAIVTFLGPQAGTDRTMFAVWDWDKENTKEYEIKWYYDTGNNVWFIGDDTTFEHRQSVYSAPSNALRVRFVVRPVSETRTVNNKETAYWTAEWSTEKIYSISDNPPSVPPVPEVTIKDYTLTATLDNLHELNATHIRFEVFQDNAHLFSSGTVEIITYHAEFSCTIVAGSVYKVCCRSVRGSELSDWSQFSNNATTKPGVSTGITTCKATSETSVYLEWSEVANATGYEIEYATKKEYFDGSNQTTAVSDIKYSHYEIGGLETGSEYFFRVRAINDEGESPWTDAVSVVIGTKPTSPTTWSSTTSCVVGDPLTLNWAHNCEDNSAQTYAEVEIYIDGVKETHTIDTVDEEEDEKTTYYEVNTSGYVEGTKLEWRVRTAGVTQEYGDWSIQRTVDIYAPPTVVLNVTNSSGDTISVLDSFPLYITGYTGPVTQTPIGYHVVIVANSSYEAVDNIGNTRFINIGEEVYSKHFDTSANLILELSAGHIDLHNNVEYTVTCTAAMNSGLSASASRTFTVAWTDETYHPNAEIGIDHDTLTAIIRPYCVNEKGNLVEDVTLSVYRREFDGGFTEVVSGVANSESLFVTDPHPALDYARYRVVATSNSTGAVSFYDVPGYPVGENAVIIQWAEEWSILDGDNPDPVAHPTWTGSLLKLPYNIDVSNDYTPDVSFVKYIGRKHPVTYYGTQRGETATWNVAIDRKDEETLYALRRLSVWFGDVYVREPSGSGYWANVTVSFNQKHLQLTIPVTLKITRVEGGV